MSKTIGIGVLGAAGEAAEGHILGFKADPRARIVAGWDANLDALEQRAAELGIERTYATLEELLADPEVDAVVIATPDHFHGDHAVAALEAGKHVLCEKPMATTRADAKRIVDAQRAAGTIFLGGHVYHFRPDYRLLAQSYWNGDIGTGYLVDGDYVSNLSAMYGEDGRTPWRSAKENAQNIMIGGGCHPVGLMRWVMRDEIVEVTAYSNHLAEPRLNIDDAYVAILKFKGGAIGRLGAAAGDRGHTPDGGHIRVHGTNGTLFGAALYRDPHTSYRSPEPKRDFAEETKDQPPRITGNKQVHYWAEQAEHFLDCIEGKAEPLTTAVDGARVVAVLTAAVESANSGTPVTVDNDF